LSDVLDVNPLTRWLPSARRKENPMPTALDDMTVDDHIAALEAELASIDAERAGDPLAAADEPAEWGEREADRTRRATAAAQRLKAVRQHGVLVTDPANATALTTYNAIADDSRRELRYVVRNRAFRSGGNSPRRALETWWSALQKLTGALPSGEPAARQLLAREYGDLLAGRDAIIDATLTGSGHGQPFRPEGADGSLPAGLRYGVHLVPSDPA
jgi:hypothetical protein